MGAAALRIPEGYPSNLIRVIPAEGSDGVYRFLFEETERNPQKQMKEIVCGTCHPLILSTIVKYAYSHDIKYVFGGQSPDETNSFYYRIPRWKIKVFSTPKLIRKSNIFSKNELDIFWNGWEHSIKRIPRYFAPYHVIPYNIRHIRETLNETLNIPLDRTNPGVTNCKILLYMGAKELKEGKPFPYTYNFAEQVRGGHLDRDEGFKFVNALKMSAIKVHDEVARKLDFGDNLS